MSYDFDIVRLTAATLDPDTNMVSVKATSQITEEEGDVEPLGDLGIYGSLGVTSRPWPADDTGECQGVVLRSFAGLTGAVVGARDTRAGAVYANLKDGDSCLHATDPEAAAQFQAKSNKQAVMVTKDSGGDTMILALDGKNDKVQLAAFGAIIQIDKAGDSVFITNPSGKASIQIAGDAISLIGKVILGGATPLMPLYHGPPVAPVGVSPGAPIGLFPSAGVFIGV